MTTRLEDPVLRSSRREATLVMLIWLAACVFTVGYCYVFGYDRDAATLTYVLGFPDWVFWGIITPWTACTLLSFVLSYFVIRDEDLGEEQAEADLAPLEATLGEEGEHA